MALDIAALKAKLAARSTQAPTPGGISNENTPAIHTPTVSVAVTNNSPVSSNSISHSLSSPSSGDIHTETDTPPIFHIASIDTESIPLDHINFLAKLNDLHSALLSRHPKLPFLLKQIHKQISDDPEIVTLLNEDAIGVIVNSLKEQTNTELVGTVLKQAKSRDKKVALNTDMF